MKQPSLQITLIIICVILSIFLQGCAVFDNHLFNPAASHARVDPLFRTADCANYKAPDGRHWLDTIFSSKPSTRNMSSFMFKDICEHQARSIIDSSVERIRKERVGNDVVERPYLDKDGDKNVIERDRLYFKICEPASGVMSSSDCLNYLVNKSDEICEIHKSHIYGNRTAMNTLLGTLAMGAGVAGTMTGASAAHYLAGSAGFITGGQAIMNKEVYQNLITEAILLEIDTNRKSFLNSLAYLNQTTGCSTHGIGEIRRDATKYHNMCSFYDGLASLMNKAGDPDITSVPAVQKLTSEKTGLEEKIEVLKADKKVLDDNTSRSQAQEDKLTEITKKLEAEQKKLATINEILANFVHATGATK